MKYYLIIKGNEDVLRQVRKWMNLKSIMESERNQRERLSNA